MTAAPATPAGVPALPRAAVLGTGAWGTTFAMVLADAGCDVAMWGRSPEVCDQITAAHRNSRNLAGITLPASITASTDAAGVLHGRDLIAIAVPSQSARTTLAALRAHWPAGATAVSLMKGVELGTDERMSQVISESLGIPESHVVVVSGPNLAREIAEHQPTATVVAGSDPQRVAQVAAACSTPYFRPYTNTDVVGVELCGAVKNVIAIAVGIAQGRGFGLNTTATIITRGLVEITRLGVALGAEAETFGGLAGLGDLMATCASPLSRNHTLGRHLGLGLDLREAIATTGGTAEGVKSATSVLELAGRHSVEMPITAAVAAVLHDGAPVADMASVLLARPKKAEGL